MNRMIAFKFNVCVLNFHPAGFGVRCVSGVKPSTEKRSYPERSWLVGLIALMETLVKLGRYSERVRYSCRMYFGLSTVFTHRVYLRMTLFWRPEVFLTFSSSRPGEHVATVQSGSDSGSRVQRLEGEQGAVSQGEEKAEREDQQRGPDGARSVAERRAADPHLHQRLQEHERLPHEEGNDTLAHRLDSRVLKRTVDVAGKCLMCRHVQISDLDTEDSKKDTMVDVVFKKALKEFRLNIFNSYSTALAVSVVNNVNTIIYSITENWLIRPLVCSCKHVPCW